MPNTPKNPTATQAAKTGVHVPLLDEDALHVPKGVSRGTFLFLVLLIIFLMVIWVGGGELMGIAGGNQNPVVARFDLPSGGQVEWTYAELQTEHRAVMDAFQVDMFLALQLGIDASKPQRDDLTRIMVLDRIAQDTGIEITDSDLRDHLDETLNFQRATREDFKNIVRARGMNQVTTENTIRMLLRVARFQQLIGFVGAVPDPAKIEEQWHQENEEFAFDYVVLEIERLREEARKELPDEAGLKAWFEGLSEGEKAEFKTAEKRKAELAVFRAGGAELLAAYPEFVPEGTEATPVEELADQYYDRVSWRRFVKPIQEGDEAIGNTSSFFTPEEVLEECLAEGPVYFAMQRWIEDLNARRTNGEEIDFGAEAQKLGLEHRAFDEPISQEVLASEDGANDAQIADAIFNTSPDGSVYLSPVALPDGLAVVRATDVSEPEIQPFEAVRDEAVEMWLGPKAEELALARLTRLREEFEVFTPTPKEGEPEPASGETRYRTSSEAFAAAVQAQGMDVRARDFLNRASPVTKDPLADDEERRELYTQANTWGLYGLESDEVAAPALGRSDTMAYLVRLAGRRAVPIDNMSPTQYDRYKRSVRSRAVSEVGQTLDLDFLKASYGLWLHEESSEGEDAGDN